MMELLAALRSRLDAGEAVVGTFLNLGSPVAAEAAGVAGFDWALIDHEHGSGSEASLLPQLLALEVQDVVALVRVEDHARPRFGFALDRGAAGIMVPRVESAADAAAAVRAMRYPPGGQRGVATLNRACRFGRGAAEMIPAFNDQVLGVMQIESPGAVAAASEIAAVDGVDVLFVGPMDLSHSMGIPGRIDDPRFRDALDTVRAAAQSAGKATGILAASAEAAARYVDEGFRFIAVGSDSSFMLGAMSEALATLKG